MLGPAAGHRCVEPDRTDTWLPGQRGRWESEFVCLDVSGRDHTRGDGAGVQETLAKAGAERTEAAEGELLRPGGGEEEALCRGR